MSTTQPNLTLSLVDAAASEVGSVQLDCEVSPEHVGQLGMKLTVLLLREGLTVFNGTFVTEQDPFYSPFGWRWRALSATSNCAPDYCTIQLERSIQVIYRAVKPSIDNCNTAYVCEVEMENGEVVRTTPFVVLRSKGLCMQHKHTYS